MNGIVSTNDEVGSIPTCHTQGGTTNNSALFFIQKSPRKTRRLDLIKRLSSYLVWVGVKFSNAIEEELLINDASQIGSKKFDFSIE